MNKISKEYISEVKTLFPIMGKSEKKYISNLKTTVEDYCGNVDITSKETLYENFGTPNDVVNSYYSTVDINYIIKKIKSAKYIKICFTIILILAIVAVSTYCLISYSEHKDFENDNIFFEETVIE